MPNYGYRHWRCPVKQADRDKIEARERLAEMLKPGDTVRTIIRHVSSSGLTRSISTVLIDENGEPFEFSYLAAKLVGSRVDQKNGGVVRQGVGMDMGFDLVYSISRNLFPDGFGCIGKGCPSNDHSNGDRDYTPHMNGAPNTFTPGYVGHWHKSGGYALKHRWL